MAEAITQVLGIVSIKNRGEYNPETTYEKLNTVRYQGQTYCAKTDTQGNLPTNTVYWDLMVEKGEKGDKPVKGVDYWTENDKSEIEADLSSDVKDEVTNQLSNLTSATPLAASSTAGMTDTSRIYVNTTDGHWYWYNGSSWVDGGVYQSTGLDNSSVEINHLSTFKNDLYNVKNANDLGWFPLTTYNGIYTDSNDVISSKKFKQYKGQIIRFSDNYTKRVTIYDLDGNYLSNTGSFRAMSSYEIIQDCLVVVSLGGNGTAIPISEGNSSNVIVDIYSSKDYIENIYKEFERVWFNSPTKTWLPAGNFPRLTISRVLQTKEDIKVSLNNTNNISYAYLFFGSNDITDLTLDSGWLKSEIIIPKGTYFMLAIKYDDFTNPTFDILDNLDIVSTYSIGEIDEKVDNLQSEIDDISTTANYFYEGEALDVKKHGFDVTHLYQVGQDGVEKTHQGMAVNNGVLFQLCSNDSVKLYNFETGEFITALDIVSDHGDVIDFSNEKYDNNDEFNIAYITADLTPCKVYKSRITRTETTLLKTYLFPLAQSGYYAGHCGDYDNNIMYIVGYTNTSYRIDDGTNKMIVSVWDLSNETQNQDGTYTPTFIKSFTIPFIETVQGQRYFNGKLVLESSDWADRNTTIYIVDPAKECVVSKISDFPSTIKDMECEAVEFIENGNKYDMIISTVDRNYYRITFK